jgi:hypothetical protein
MEDEKPQVDIEYTEPQALPLPGVTDVETVSGFIPTYTSVPSHTPKKFQDQFVMYVSGGTKRLYIYDVVSNAWRYATLT